jgi:hypothetical protein
MATNKYTVQGNSVDPLGRQIFRATELVGDSVFDNNMISSGTLTVVPDSGYTVTASDFSISNYTALTAPFLDDGTENPDYRWIDSIVLTDTDTAGSINNTILITVSFASGGPRGPLTLAGNFSAQLDIDGKVNIANIVDDISFDETIVIEEEISIINPINEDDNIVPNNGADVTFTEATDINKDVTSPSDNFTEINIVGDATPDKAVDIGNVSIVADADKFFPETPFLTFAGMPSGILSLRSPVITRDSKSRATAYNFKLIYKSKVSTKNSPGKAYIRYKTAKIPTVTREISKIMFGSPQVSSKGDTREIKVYGDSDAEFDLVITKLTDGSSILNKNIAKKTIITPEYGSVRALSKKLLATGRQGGKTAFKFDQEFPSHVSAIIKTRLNMAGNLSGTKAIFDTLSGVVVGDRITADNIPNSTIVTVTALDPDGDNANECNLSSSIDLTDDDSVAFYRPQKYYINIYPKEGTTLGSNIPVQNPRYTINQYDSPILMLKVINTDAQINANSILYNYTGRANAFPSQVRNVPSMFSVSWDLTRSGGTFSAVKTDGIPAFSSTERGLSDWSNSVYATNGGMHIEIFNEKVTGIGTSTCTITADVIIKKWGTESVTMILNLDNILT